MWVVAWESALLSNPRVMPRLRVCRPHLEKQGLGCLSSGVQDLSHEFFSWNFEWSQERMPLPGYHDLLSLTETSSRALASAAQDSSLILLTFPWGWCQTIDNFSTDTVAHWLAAAALPNSSELLWLPRKWNWHSIYRNFAWQEGKIVAVWQVSLHENKLRRLDSLKKLYFLAFLLLPMFSKRVISISCKAILTAQEFL